MVSYSKPVYLDDYGSGYYDGLAPSTIRYYGGGLPYSPYFLTTGYINSYTNSYRSYYPHNNAYGYGYVYY